MKETTFHLREHLLFALLTVLTLILCIGVGSVSVPFRDTAEIIFRAIAGWEQPSGSAVAIILYTRLPRVLCVALVGAMLALGGCGQKQAEKDTKVETTEAETTEAEEDSTQNVVSDGEANFSVDSEMVTEFAQKVQLLVASEDLEGLADVTFIRCISGLQRMDRSSSPRKN